MSALRLDTLLDPHQALLAEVAARELANFRKAVNAEADRITGAMTRTDAQPVTLDVQRFDTAPTSYIDDHFVNPNTRRNASMRNRDDAGEGNFDGNVAAAMQSDNTPDDPKDPVVIARRTRDEDASDAWIAPGTPRYDARQRAKLRARLAMFLGDDLPEEDTEAVVKHFESTKASTVTGDGALRALRTIREQRAGGIGQRTDAGDEDVAMVERARAQRDADARDAWKGGR